MDLVKVLYPGHLKKSLHPRVDMDKFHVTSHLPDAAKAPGQFAQAIAVNEVHALEIDQELLVAVADEDMKKCRWRKPDVAVSGFRPKREFSTPTDHCTQDLLVHFEPRHILHPTLVSVLATKDRCQRVLNMIG